MIQNFYMHRAAFERLRTMLSEDNHLVRVASWGVQTTESVLSTTPPTKNLSLDRYKEYLALLKETGSTVALRGEGAPPANVGIGVYASGFGGDTRHIDVCWMGRPPTNQVSSLDEFYKNPRPVPAFRHIEGNWYLWADR